MNKALKYVLSMPLVILLSSCSGDSPSISVQPSEDFFEAAGKELTAKMDILFVVDNSVSMREEQEDMMANFSTFIKNFVGKGYDYRIAVIGTDAWITKGFFDTRTDSPFSRDGLNYVLMDEYLNNEDEHTDSTVIPVNNDGSIITSYTSDILSPDYYSGFPDLNFKASGGDYYRRLCSRTNYITSRFSEGDYTKALLGSPKGTHNGESGQDKRDADNRYLSGYRIVSSSDDTIDTNFYLDEGEIDEREYELLRNREMSFYDLAGVEVEQPEGKKHILDIFRNNIMQGLDGCYGESGLESAKVALENSFNQNFAGGPFPREDAHLAIIVVSDMRDEMAGIRDGDRNITIPNYTLGSDTSDNFSQERLDYYHNYFSSISSESYGYTLHSIVPTGQEVINLSQRYTALDPPEPTAEAPQSFVCDEDNRNSSFCYVAIDTQVREGEARVTNDEIQPDVACFTEWRETRKDSEGKNITVPREAKMYTKLSKKTGGQKASICGDFASKLENIAKVIIERTVEFKMDKKPKSLDLLFVSVKEPNDSSFQDIPQQAPGGTNGWTYNETANSIVFHGEDIPAQGSEISLVYDRDSLN